VLVNDSHGDMRNLVLEELDARAELITGSLKPLSMVQGVTSAVQRAVFVGYHAGAASQAGILDHTYYGRVVARLRVNGVDWNETAINAAVCGALGVPVAFVSGDETTCAQARDHLGDVVTVATKDAITRYCARTLHPTVACERIRRGVADGLRHGGRIFAPPPPLELEIDFVSSACADIAELVPGTRRSGGASCCFAAPDPATLLQVIQAWTILAGTVVV
jgi:D-amino peptidase